MTASATDRPLLALVLRLGGIAGIATMAALIKIASDRGVHIAEIIFWRQGIAIPMLLGWALARGGLASLGTKRPRAHLMRSVYGFVGMVLNFGAVILLPLAEATTFSFTAPLWAVILSMVILHEKVGLWRWSSVVAGFAGVLIIAQPGGHAIPLGGAAAALGGAFMVALISLQIRDLGRTEKPVTIVFWFAAISTLLALPALPFTMRVHAIGDYALLAGIGVAGTVGQLLITAALRYGQVSSVIVMDYSALVWATLYGWLFFAVLPPAATWIGAPLIIAAGVIIA
ncbi:EamA family transporter [Erythrobacter arachoides]|uniref:EamA family transporter n=2 Tax=Aurantiacibacter arachoides TaxID=1850444 RepID=A0A844ZZC6_9SPHN|nr:EamA family transporter [Aurantiacibacter arachoides]